MRNILLIMFAVIICFIAVSGIRAYARFERKTWRIKMRILRTDNARKKQYWRRQLCSCYLGFLSLKVKKKEWEPYRLLAPSVLGLCICVICLCGTSWAWFTSTQSSNVNQIQSAQYTVKVEVKNESDQILPIWQEGNSYMLELDAGIKYTVSFTAQGTASKGFCNINLKKQEDVWKYYTSEVAPGGTFTFSVKSQENVVLRVIPQWGDHFREGVEIIQEIEIP